MTCVAEIDEAGRIMLPAELCAELKVQPGDKLVLEVDGRSLHAHAQSGRSSLDPAIAGRLVEEDGLLVFHLDQPLPPEHVDWLRQDRVDRLDGVTQPQSGTWNRD